MSWDDRINILTAALHITPFSFVSVVQFGALTAILQILVKINRYPSFPYLLPDLGRIQYKRSAHSAVVYLWVLWKPAQGRTHFTGRNKPVYIDCTAVSRATGCSTVKLSHWMTCSEVEQYSVCDAVWSGRSGQTVQKGTCALLVETAGSPQTSVHF